ncbi:MAG TPA: hypothetical protein VJ771_03615 [Candidatus Nitrosotalea sp.]|nr:hypothetical protein [Candidatus Nitrosotalea sp.]
MYKGSVSPGKTFPEETVWLVWSKGIAVGGNDPVMWRKDECGAWIFRADYENKVSEFGWVIDNIELLNANMDHVSNLRPMHWKNVTRKDDGTIECRTTSVGTHNGLPIEKKVIEVPSVQDYYYTQYNQVF